MKSLINEIEKEVKKSESDEFNKAYSELFGEDLFEKAKHQIGDSHPKWPQLKWTDLGGGKFGWRTGTGRGKRGNAGNAGQASTSSGENAGNSGEQKDLSTHAKETDTKEDKKLRPVGTGTNGPERRRRLAPHSTHAKTATEKKGENIEISSIKDKALREKITRYVEEATDGEYSESDYTWKDVLTALRNPSEKDIRASLEKKFGVTVDLASNDDEGKKKSENSDSMTAEQLFKKYNIPETTVEEINTKRGYEYDRRKVKSAKDEYFISRLKKAIKKYGAPIEVKKRPYNTYNQNLMNHSIRHEIEYEYYKGNVVDVTFKVGNGQTYVVSSDESFSPY